MKVHDLRALKSSIVEEPEVVMQFLDTLTQQLRPRAEEDFDNMRKMKQQLDPTAGVR